MRRNLIWMAGLIACVFAMNVVHAEVVEVGRGQVTRFEAGDDAGGAEAIATGELVEGSGLPVRVALADSSQQVSMSVVQARTVHELLGQMLAVNEAGETNATDTPAEQTPDEPATSQQAAVKKPFLGMNLAGVTYYTRGWVFTDLMLLSDAWRDDNRGYIFKSGMAPTGVFVATWAGSGSVKFSGDVSSNQTGSNSASVVIGSGNEGINLQKLGQVSDVSLIAVDHEMRVSPFNPVFESRIEPFQVIRFMDWASTNTTKLKQWSQRPRKGQQTQTGENGVAIEYMIQLANELKADPWFCMPHMADDDYIRKHAELVKERLHPDAKVYIEYSNEVWNGQFGQHKYIRQLAGGTDSFSDAFFDTWAERCKTTFRIWTEVFGDEAEERLVRVAAVQLANPWVAEQLTSRLDGQFDAISPAAYFGITHGQGEKLNTSPSVDRLLDMCEENIRGDNRKWFNRHGELAKQWSQKLGRPIRLIAYEGGQHLTAHGNDNLPYYDQLIEAQTHPRMYGLYLLNMRLFEVAGGDLFVAFNDVGRPGKFGSWGHLEYQDQPISEAPKYRALIEYPSLKEK